MSKSQEDEIYEIFKRIRENKGLEESWCREMIKLERDPKYVHITLSNRYITAYYNIKNDFVFNVNK